MTGPFGLEKAPSITAPNAAQTFSQDADLFFQSLKTFESNLAAYGNAISVGFFSTSTSNLAMPAEGDSVTLTVEARKGYATGFPMKVSASVDVWFLGTVTAYDSATGVLTMRVEFVVGVGTYNRWNVSLSAPLATLGVQGMSSSSFAIPAVGVSVSFTASVLRTWKEGDTLQVVSRANPNSTRFVGTVTAYNISTGALTLTCKWARGSGTLSSWMITPAVNDTLLNMWTAIDSTTNTTLDLSLANHFVRTVASPVTFAFTNAPIGQSFGFSVRVVFMSGSITWPSSVVWADEVTPILTANRTYRFFFNTDNGGTTMAAAFLSHKV